MDFQIRPLHDSDVEDLVQLSLLAWVPIFESFERLLGRNIFALIWPDWCIGQWAAIEAVCREREKTRVLVAELEGRVVGFLAYEIKAEDEIGEVQLLAVHPEYQNRGIGTALSNWALDDMRAGGMKIARVETGGDPPHAPARRSYEKAGYTGLPLVRYFQDL